MIQLILSVLLSASFTFAVSAAPVRHKFESGETLWFLAQIYYGKGERYTEILKANHLQASTKVQDGQILLIPNPVYNSDQPAFRSRQEHLRSERAEKLARKGSAKIEFAKPSTVGQSTTPHHLPLSMSAPRQTPQEKAQAEIEKH